LNEFKKALNIRERIFGQEHITTTTTYFKIGQCHFKLNQTQEALNFFKKCYEIRKKIYSDKSSIYLAYALGEIIECFEKLGDMDSYKIYRQESLKIKRELFKRKHPNKDYFDFFCVRGKDKGKPAWHYILIEDELKYQEIKKQKPGKNIDVTDYGRILESGWGKNPPKNIVEKINKEYGYEPDY
jgi:tetratricopeptide (TPR) repeat protein